MATRYKSFGVAAGAGFVAPEFECVQTSTTSGTFVTVLNITGGGFYYLINAFVSDLAGEIRITVDGYTGTFTLSTSLNQIRHTLVSDDSSIWGIGSSGTNTSKLWFQDNLLVELRKTTGATAYCKIDYGKV